MEHPPSLLEQAPIVEIPERSYDIWLLAAVFALLTIGTIEVFSASAVLGLKKHGSSMHFLSRQLVWLVLGAGAMWYGARTDYRWLRRWTYPLLALTLLLLVIVLPTMVTSEPSVTWIPPTCAPAVFRSIKLPDSVAWDALMTIAPA
jgi:cell division protein FtsW (lipid II flippase)